MPFSFCGMRDLLERELIRLEAVPIAKINGAKERVRGVCEHLAVLVSLVIWGVTLEGCVSFLFGDNCHSGCGTLDWPSGGLGVATTVLGLRKLYLGLAKRILKRTRS